MANKLRQAAFGVVAIASQSICCAQYVLLGTQQFLQKVTNVQSSGPLGPKFYCIYSLFLVIFRFALEKINIPQKVRYLLSLITVASVTLLCFLFRGIVMLTLIAFGCCLTVNLLYNSNMICTMKVFSSKTMPVIIGIQAMMITLGGSIFVYLINNYLDYNVNNPKISRAYLGYAAFLCTIYLLCYIIYPANIELAEQEGQSAKTTGTVEDRPLVLAIPIFIAYYGFMMSDLYSNIYNNKVGVLRGYNLKIMAFNASMLLASNGIYRLLCALVLKSVKALTVFKIAMVIEAISLGCFTLMNHHVGFFTSTIITIGTMPAANFALAPIILKEQFGMKRGPKLISYIFLMIPLAGISNFLLNSLGAQIVGWVIIMAMVLSSVLDIILNKAYNKTKTE